MALSDRQHHDAYEALTEAFADRTDVVIDMLRPDHDQLATKSDLDPIRGDIAAVRRDVDELRGDVDGIRHDVAILRSDMGHMEVRLLAAIDRRVHDAFAAQTRTLMIGLVMAFLLTALTNVLTVTLG